jgi:hypothetical protein
MDQNRLNSIILQSNWKYHSYFPKKARSMTFFQVLTWESYIIWAYNLDNVEIYNIRKNSHCDIMISPSMVLTFPC